MCPLYLASTSGNPLKVCGPEERLGYAPSSAHLRVFAFRLQPMMNALCIGLGQRSARILIDGFDFSNKFLGSSCELSIYERLEEI